MCSLCHQRFGAEIYKCPIVGVGTASVALEPLETSPATPRTAQYEKFNRSSRNYENYSRLKAVLTLGLLS